MPTQSSGGYLTHFIRSGHGSEDALFLHCSLADAGACDGVTARLADELSILAMDLPGHGQSADWEKSDDYAAQAVAMAAGLLEAPAHLVGHSYGAYAALRLAVDRPDLARSLTLVEPVYFAAAKRIAPDLFKAYKRSSVAFMGAISVGDMASAARAFMVDWGDGRPWESHKPDAMEYITNRMPLVAAGGPSLVEDNGDVYNRLRQLTVPCLLVLGTESPPIIAAIQGALAGALPYARREVIEGAGHMAPLTHPVETAALIAEFIAGQPQSSEIS